MVFPAGQAEPTDHPNAAAYDRNLSVTMTAGANSCFLRRLRISFRGCGFVASVLHGDVEHLAFVIDRAPEVHCFAGDPRHHLIEMPAPAWFWSTMPQASCEGGFELQHPPPHVS